jgi:hypothetical protein
VFSVKLSGAIDTAESKLNGIIDTTTDLSTCRWPGFYVLMAQYPCACGHVSMYIWPCIHENRAVYPHDDVSMDYRQPLLGCLVTKLVPNIFYPSVPLRLLFWDDRGLYIGKCLLLLPAGRGGGVNISQCHWEENKNKREEKSENVIEEGRKQKEIGK